MLKPEDCMGIAAVVRTGIPWDQTQISPERVVSSLLWVGVCRQKKKKKHVQVPDINYHEGWRYQQVKWKRRQINTDSYAYLS